MKHFSFLFKNSQEKEIFVVAAVFSEEDDEQEQHEEEMVAIKRLEKDLKDGFKKLDDDRVELANEMKQDKREVMQ